MCVTYGWVTNSRVTEAPEFRPALPTKCVRFVGRGLTCQPRPHILVLEYERKNLTDAEMLVLGLVAEMPRHGYQLDQVIEERGMRKWTQIGFSSIYYVLEQARKDGAGHGERPAGAKANTEARRFIP